MKKNQQRRNTYEDKEWIDESGKASDTSATVYLDADCWNFNTKEQRPSLYQLPRKPMEAVTSERKRTTVNRRHQQHFEALKETEQHNLDQKTVICEIIEAIDYNELTNFSSWENKTQEIIALQNKWKTIGFAPQKMNVKIFERFRKA